MSEVARDRLIRFIPWVIGLVVALVVIYTVPMRPNSLPVYLSLGLPGLIGGILSWIPPFQAAQIRHLKRTYPKRFRSWPGPSSN